MLLGEPQGERLIGESRRAGFLFCFDGREPGDGDAFSLRQSVCCLSMLSHGASPCR